MDENLKKREAEASAECDNESSKKRASRDLVEDTSSFSLLNLQICNQQDAKEDALEKLQKMGKADEQIPSKIKLIQGEATLEDGWKGDFMEEILRAIAKLKPEYLHFVDVGKGWRLGLELAKLTELLESLREGFEGMILDGVHAYVEEGYPVCDGPMGLNEFEDAITDLMDCKQFDLINDFQIKYLGNPAYGFFVEPIEMKLASIKHTIKGLPTLSDECKAKIKVTKQEVAEARAFNEQDKDADY
ncbi:hypothetical protein CTEN210_13507 [Chaetoceros tenuissimus]|uniref:Uncharacterized protein n=1 Tax=Chaetoceros tenuissimus TaxID=426638 RepID=A0AAD3HBA9_9STRA|nr:hypothetical protein CTEN210_13507 [Chaetoceros tenuissimus]